MQFRKESWRERFSKSLRTQGIIESNHANVSAIMRYAMPQYQSEEGLSIHIGLHKTGTTALQKWLAMHRDILGENNVLYPYAGCLQHDNSQRSLALEILDNNRIGGECSAWKELYGELQRSGCKKAIISTEIFARSAFTQDKLEMLRERTIGMKPLIVMYLRNPVDYYVAFFKHSIRSRYRFTGSFRDFIEHYTAKDNTYKNLVEKWAHIFGEENVIVRSYDKAKTHGNLGRDFLRSSGVRANILTELPLSNQSLATSQLKALRLINWVESRLSEPVGRHTLTCRIIGRLKHKIRRGSMGWGVPVSVLSWLDRNDWISEQDLAILRKNVSGWSEGLVTRGWLSAEDGAYLDA